MPRVRLSEQRARAVARELLSYRGWDIRPISSGGQLLEEAEYRAYQPLAGLFEGESKTGSGFGKPDFLLVNSSTSLIPLLVIDTKAHVSDLDKSILDTNHYGDACGRSGKDVLSVAVAGADRELCEVRVQRKAPDGWRFLTLHERPIDWIPSPEQTLKLLPDQESTEVEPERPPEHILAAQANRLNEIFRECKISDPFRPIYAAAFMLGLWYGEVSPSPEIVLTQINSNAQAALRAAGKSDLEFSLRIDTENAALADRAWQILDILRKLNIRSFMQEHDYLGQLYETFFRYTGGNTIGQYFTPRHIIAFICDVVGVTPNDTVFDPACGTGGFLIGALNRMIQLKGIPYKESVELARNNLYGMESEPTTAALCVTNMILRGDGKSGIIRADSLTNLTFPETPVDCALLNPPFPHRKTDTPPTEFVDRAIAGVRHRGTIASIVPYSLLLNTGDWHRRILKDNRLLMVVSFPPDLFEPYSTFNTALVVLEKGVPHEDSRVFFGRMSNDGFKVKKKMRIPRPGSQLDQLLDAYETKSEIPEFSAYKSIIGKEWAPEAYIENAPHQDEEFLSGFEEAIRKQAAFYIGNGHKLMPGQDSEPLTISLPLFSGESKLSLVSTPLGPFRLDEYFDVELGGKNEIEDLEDGDLPIITTSEFQNGLTNWKGSDKIYHPPAITVATDGSTCSAFVQEYPFYAFYKVAILRPRTGLRIPLNAMYFVAYLLTRERWRYLYARKFGKARIKATTLYGPIKEGEPDFERMAEMAEQCIAFPVIDSFKETYYKRVQTRFSELEEIWKSTRGPTPTVGRMVQHPAYMKIISLGDAAIPNILESLRKNPDHWFVALHKLTGATPVPEASSGNIQEMAAAWLSWGRERGYVE